VAQPRLIHCNWIEDSMLQRLLARQAKGVGLGLGLKPGDEHYRAYVGPPEDYDLVSAMVFNLLTSIGLRQHHRLLDVGCGSLRAGRLLIPYLGRGNYFGIEPNRWLVEEGVKHETGRDLIKLREPVFSFLDSMDDFKEPLQLDYAVAQSIFSHCGMDLILAGDKDYDGTGWVYPGCVDYRPETMARLASELGFDFRVLDWAHPRQTWALFSKKGYDGSLVDGGQISWNRLVAKTMRGSA
jgi:SAM-dependent methyltransferase